MTEQADSSAPDAATCQGVTAEFGLEMPVLFDADRSLETVLDMPVNSGELLLTEGNIIHSKSWGAHDGVARRLEEIYGF